MELPSLKDILASSKEKLEGLLAGPRAKQARIRGELKMAELEEKICTHNQNILEQLAKKDLDFDKIMDEIEEVGLLELRHSNFKDLLGQLFPVETATVASAAPTVGA